MPYFSDLSSDCDGYCVPKIDYSFGASLKQDDACKRAIESEETTRVCPSLS